MKLQYHNRPSTCAFNFYVHRFVKERKREQLETIKKIDFLNTDSQLDVNGGIRQVYQGPAGGSGRGRGRGDGGGPEYKGLGAGRAAEEQQSPQDSFDTFRKQRSGTYHALIGAGRGK